MAATVLDCTDLAGEVDFFTGVGFRVRLVSPADDPRRIVVELDGHELELRRAARDRPIRIRIEGDRGAGHRTSPGGSIVEVEPVVERLELPANQQTLSVVQPSIGEFGVGRAGMEYRDLLPDRWGGRFIASHIRIADEGDVSDWVHFHRIRFQMIYVAAGWVEVVYEDQGAPFRMVEGDCVLQPPEIRHRVLRSSAGLEVIEIGCPAEHDTLADHDLELPTGSSDPDRDFGGQRFVRHVAAESASAPWIDPSFTGRDTGIGAATNGLAGAVVVSSASTPSGRELTHDGEFVLVVALDGSALLDVGDAPVDLRASTSVAIPAGTVWRWAQHSTDHSALVVALPADGVRRC